MKKQHFYVLGILVAFILAGFLLNNQPKQADASTTYGSDYRSSMATSTMGSATVSYSLNTTPGAFNSVIVIASSTGSQTGLFRIWDATSTATSTYQTADNTQTTLTYGRLIASFPNYTNPQTYIFDVSVFKGLVMEVPVNFTGTYVVTYR